MSITGVVEVERDTNGNTFSTNLTWWDTNFFFFLRVESKQRKALGVRE